MAVKALLGQSVIHPGYKTGSFYSTWIGGADVGAAVAAVDVIYFYPFPIFFPVTVVTLHMRVTTGGTGSSAKCAIWANSAVSNRPLGAPLIVDNTGQATTSTNSNTSADVTDTVLTPGWYWAGSKHTGTLPSMAMVPANNQTLPFFTGVNSSGAPVISAISFADAYANDMPTLTEGASFTNVTANAAPILVLGT
jgi:hypothetical protein